MRHATILLRLTGAALVAVLAGTAPAAQAPKGPGDDLPSITAVRLTGPVALDGALDDAVWRRPPDATRFVQDEPYNGGAPTESTWVWFAYDDEALYVAARMWDAHPDSIVAPLFRRDDFTTTDWAGLILDPFHDHRTGYEFIVTPAGALLDATRSNDNNEDSSWDGVWAARTRRDSLGWTCELRIPFSQMRFNRSQRRVWGVDFGRCIARRGEKDFQAVCPSGASGFESRFPHLVGIEGIRDGHTIELSPYVTGKAEYLVHPAGDPLFDGSRYTPAGGADLRTSLGSNLTLNATANPDFGQVEVDPAVVNLSDVESFFQEKRPFFTENAHVFTLGQDGPNSSWGMNWPEPTFFYSRRIGRTPQGGPPEDALFSDLPLATHILGAAKLTGQPAPGWNFGTLQAVTSRERAKVWRDGASSRVEVEPLTYYGVLRGQRESAGGRDGLGVLATLAQRSFGDGGRLGDELDRQSLMTGLDGWHFLDAKRVWILSGWGALSRVAGSTARMAAVQRSPLHYFQRPDAGYLGVKDVTSLTGFAGRLALNKQEGSIAFNSAVGMLDPRFDVSDMGYQYYADVVNAHAMAGYRWLKPNRWQTNSRVYGYVASNWDCGGDRTWSEAGATGHVTFASHHYTNAEVDWYPAALSARATRGGPRMASPASYSLYADYTTDESRRTSLSTTGSVQAAPGTGSLDWAVSPTLSWKPAPRLSLSLGPSFERNVQDAQYVTSVAAGGEVPADFGGRRYVFARLEQTTVGAGIRLNVTFTPTLSLQTYVQPFLSAGRFRGFKELARAGAYDFVLYGRDGGSSYTGGTVTPAGGGTAFALRDPSFNYASLRGNAVVRWEYRPGSALYLVWTQLRADEQAFGELRFGPSTRRLLDVRADDVLLVKATYYFTL